MRTLQELYLSYLPVESRVFTLGDEDEFYCQYSEHGTGVDMEATAAKIATVCEGLTPSLLDCPLSPPLPLSYTQSISLSSTPLSYKLRPLRLPPHLPLYTFTHICCVALPSHFLPYPVLPPVLPCSALPYSTLHMPRRAVPCPAVPCRAVPCRAVPCRAVPCRAMPCRTMPCRAVPCYRPALPCTVLPHISSCAPLSLTFAQVPAWARSQLCVSRRAAISRDVSQPLCRPDWTCWLAAM